LRQGESGGVHRCRVGIAADDPLVKAGGQIRFALGVKTGRHAKRSLGGKEAARVGIEKLLELRLRVCISSRRK
jgi:hypothetical protein